jgi:hypothetical protein
MKVKVLEKYLYVMAQTFGAILQFYKNNFTRESKGKFRYAVVVNRGGFCILSEFDHYDKIIIPNSIKMAFKNAFFTPRAHIILQANGLLH